MNKMTPTRLFEFIEYQNEHAPLEKSFTTKYNGKWESLSTENFISQSRAISRALVGLGIKAGDKIAMISSNNRSEWSVIDVGLLTLGAVNIPIYPTISSKDYEYILNHSESIYCFVSNDELYDKVTNVLARCPTLKKVYSFEKYDNRNHWSEVTKLGEDEKRQNEVEDFMSAVRPEDLATIIYTSGTTGLPKGVMLSHANISSIVIASTPRIPGLTKGQAKTLSFLPVCHSFERFIQYLYIYNGASIYYAEGLDTLKADLNMVKPNIFTAVPRLLEKFFG